jgi:hypothetical protein
MEGHGMWLAIAVSYCVFCWLVGFMLARIWAPQFAERAASRGISAFRLEFGAVLIAPLVLPFITWHLLLAYIGRFRRLRQLRWALKTVREYEFAKVNSLFLAEPIRRQFERHTPALFQLGFELLGDYRMKPQPVEVHDRIFLSADGRTLATICAVANSGGVSFISVLTDGTCVHTSSVKNPRPHRTLEPRDQLCITYLPDTSIEDRHRHHLDATAKRAAATGSSVLRLKSDQFRELLIYDQRIFNRWRYRHGDLPSEPPAPDITTLCTAQASS